MTLDDILEQHSLQVWTQFSILRSMAAARETGTPLDPRLLIGVILAEANLPAEADSAAFLVRWLWKGESDSSELRDAGRAATQMLRLPDLGPAPASLAVGRTKLTHDETELLGGLLRSAGECRARTAPHEPDIDTRHMLTTLLRTSAVRQALAEKGVRIAGLRRDLFDFIVRTHPGDVTAEWRRLLLGGGFEMRTFVSRDTWTRDDALGYRLYAQAISESILDGTTEPPLTIGIQAPWGQGKTSLMRMIQERLDPDAADRDETHGELFLDIGDSIRTTYRDLLRWIREWSRSEAGLKAPAHDGMMHVAGGRIPTVWFNPLYYRETAQVWAGMAHAILHQLARQLPAAEREKFWLHLQIARINPALVRREIHQQILARAVPMGLAVCLIVFLLVTGSVGERLAESLLGLGSGTLLGLIWGKATTIGARFEKYVTEPDYRSQLGLLHLVDQDLDVALRLLVGSRPIAVFIDDLDRCDPQTVNQVVLAINQFLSLPRRNVFFFLGMDMEMVAAALEEAQKETLSAVSGTQRRSYGWRFMEKFVQLPFVIPHLDAKLARSFAVNHLRGEASTAAASTSDVIRRVEQVKYAEEIGEIARNALTGDLAPVDRANLQQAFSKRAQELMTDPDGDEIERIVALAIDDLELNPRTMKRYFALVRLLRNVQLSTGTVREPDYDRLLVLRAAHLLLNWPQFVQWLRSTTSLETLEAAAKTAKDHGTWCQKIRELAGDDGPAYLQDAPLYRFISRIAQEPPGLTEMYAGRMF